VDNSAEGFPLSAICIPLFPLTYLNKPAAVINRVLTVNSPVNRSATYRVEMQ